MDLVVLFVFESNPYQVFQSFAPLVVYKYLSETVSRVAPPTTYRFLPWAWKGTVQWIWRLDTSSWRAIGPKRRDSVVEFLPVTTLSIWYGFPSLVFVSASARCWSHHPRGSFELHSFELGLLSMWHVDETMLMLDWT